MALALGAGTKPGDGMPRSRVGVGAPVSQMVGRRSSWMAETLRRAPPPRPWRGGAGGLRSGHRRGGQGRLTRAVAAKWSPSVPPGRATLLSHLRPSSNCFQPHRESHWSCHRPYPRTEILRVRGVAASGRARVLSRWRGPSSGLMRRPWHLQRPRSLGGRPARAQDLARACRVVPRRQTNTKSQSTTTVRHLASLFPRGAQIERIGR